HLGLRFALNAFGQQRSGGLGNATTRAEKANVLDGLAVEEDEELQLVATKRVVPLGGTIGIGQIMEIARVFAMVKDDLLVKLFKIVEHAGKVAGNYFFSPTRGLASSLSHTTRSSSSRTGPQRIRSMISPAKAWINMRRAVSAPMPLLRR